MSYFNYKYLTDHQVGQIDINVPGKDVNVIDAHFFPQLQECLSTHVLPALKSATPMRGLILTSSKRDFISGANLDMIFSLKAPQEVKNLTGLAHQVLRQMETLGIPVVALLNGATLGGGFEVVLSCHARFALDHPATKIGLPEVTLGLLPGGGGTQRIPRMLGLQKGLEILLEGKNYSVDQALTLGLIHGKAQEMEELWQQALLFIAQNPQAQNPWDKADYKIPQGGVQSPSGYQVFMGANALTFKKSKDLYPAPQKILQAVYEGLQLPFEQALRVEEEYFAQLVVHPVSKNMIRTLFYGVSACQKKGPSLSTPANQPNQPFSVGVLGGGMMGKGIAMVLMRANVPVMLKDASKEMSLQAQKSLEENLRVEVQKGRLTESAATKALSYFKIAEEYKDLATCHLVIEAVPEDRKLKAEVTAATEKYLNPTAVFGSNTSTLPITSLAQKSVRPQNFIGIHFFSPVEKMPLVEIILGKETSPHATQQALHLVQLLKKTPIVVNDGRGFYTSRVFMSFVNEGIACVREGINPVVLENVARTSGMPVGPLTVADEVGLDLIHHILQQSKADGADTFIPRLLPETIATMVQEWKRVGKKCGAGFYDYSAEGKRLWPGLTDIFPLQDQQPAPIEIKQRLLYIQTLETVRCLEEGVLLDATSADVGSVFGWGFPACYGGTLSLIETVGIGSFIQACEELAIKYGQRFQVPELLYKKQKSGEGFYA